MSMSAGSSDEQERISQILTRWSLVLQARDKASPNGGAAARAELLNYYAPAITRFLYAILKRIDRMQHAEDIIHNVFVMILEGGLSGADPAKGRFRDYLKAALRYSLNRELQQIDRQGRKESPIDAAEQAQLIHNSFDSNEFESYIRFTRINQAFARLEESDAASGQVFAALLRWRNDNPDEAFDAMAAYLTRIRRKYTSPGNARTMRKRAALKYCQCLTDVIMESLPIGERSRTEVEEELQKLNLMTLLSKYRAQQNDE